MPADEFADWPLSGSPGKRLSTDQPLTEHDIADRIDKAALRLVRIMGDIRQQGGPDVVDLVKRSRYLTGALGYLAAELQLWGIEPVKSWADATSGADEEAERSAAAVLDQARATREHMERWAAGGDTHPDE